MTLALMVILAAAVAAWVLAPLRGATGDAAGEAARTGGARAATGRTQEGER